MAEVARKKVECGFESKVPVAQMLEMWNTKLPLMHAMCPDIVTGVDLLQGRFGEVGSVIVWNMNFQGKLVVAKEVVEVIDKENNRLVFRATEGGPLDYYKSFTWIFQASKEDNVVKWILEYEKKSEDDVDPTAYLDMLLSATEQVHARLLTGS